MPLTRGRSDDWLPPSVGPVEAAAVEAVAARLGARCPGRLGEQVPLAPLTTFRLGGPARLFLRAESLGDLVALAEVLAEVPVPLLVLGRGSNVLVSDAGWPGVVLHLGRYFRSVTIDGEEIEVGGATPLPSLAARSAAASLGGLAFAVAIPGSVGGGIRMNAGAHGGELSDRLLWAETIDLAAGASAQSIRVKPGDIGFVFRGSALPRSVVVTSARFICDPTPEAEVRAQIDEARRWRRENQPVNQPNCGSVFVNRPNLPGALVVERLGMKGERCGGARISEIHANFIVAGEGARSADVLELIRRVIRRARDEGDFALRPEVQLAGDFAATGPGVAGDGP
jgi:UDP-N-acetylmuramate dehydrogenase